MRKLLSLLALLLAGTTALFAQSNGLNPIFNVNVQDLTYNVPEKKATVGSVLGTIASAAAGQTTDTDHSDKLPAINAAVKSALSSVRRLSPVDTTAVEIHYTVTGEVTKVITTTQSRSVSEKDSKGKVHKRVVTDYAADITVSLTLTNLSTAETVTHTFTGSADCFSGAESENDAVNISLRKLSRNVVKYFDAAFPLAANIVERGTEKKDKTKEVYIDLGTAAGAYKGMHFGVYVIGSVAGRETRSRIGKIKVSDVLGDDITLCKVQSGGKDIKSAIDNGKTLLVVSED